MKIDYAVLLLERDKRRSKYVKERLLRDHPYFRIIPAIDGRDDWPSVERAFIENGIQVKFKFDHRPGKFGRWASFIAWLRWMRDSAEQSGFNYAVLAEDDVALRADFRRRLEQFIEQNPDRWYFRCGPYNCCLVIRCDKAGEVLEKIKASGVTLPDDHWSWKVGKVLQKGLNIARQQNFPSNINPRNQRIPAKIDPRMWAC